MCNIQFNSIQFKSGALCRWHSALQDYLFHPKQIMPSCS